MDTSTTGRRTRIQPSSLPLVSLKRKAADQPLSATQNLISEALVETSPAVNQILPNIMSLARVIQRSRAVASGSSQHQEATTSEDFTLPPTCTYLGSVIVDSEVRLLPAYPLGFWNHFARIIRDPEFPRTSNMVEGFHRGFKSRVHRPKPSVQEYVRAIKEQQVITDLPHSTPRYLLFLLDIL